MDASLLALHNNYGPMKLFKAQVAVMPNAQSQTTRLAGLLWGKDHATQRRWADFLLRQAQTLSDVTENMSQFMLKEGLTWAMIDAQTGEVDSDHGMGLQTWPA